MHELSITRNLVAIVAEAAAGRRVRRVTLAIGRLSGVMSEAVAFCFDVVAAGTPLAGAVLAIETIDGQARCRECAGEYALPTLTTRCPCGARSREILRGEELLIRTFEVEEPP